MAYTVTSGINAKINLAPETVVEEVLQNLTMILSTPKFTLPLDRNFGINTRFIDKPIPVAQSIMIGEIYDAIEKYEPRAEIINIYFKQDGGAGKVAPHVEVDIHARQ